jgi:hypothetical protein
MAPTPRGNYGKCLSFYINPRGLRLLDTRLSSQPNKDARAREREFQTFKQSSATPVTVRGAQVVSDRQKVQMMLTQFDSMIAKICSPGTG